jgi:hypothetical protein
MERNGSTTRTNATGAGRGGVGRRLTEHTTSSRKHTPTQDPIAITVQGKECCVELFKKLHVLL